MLIFTDGLAWLFIEKMKYCDKKLDNTLKKSSDTRNRILEIKRNNPEITQAEIDAMLDITIDGVKYQIRKMKKRGTDESSWR